MLWYKSWLETRWRFLTGFALLVCSAGLVIEYPRMMELLPLVPAADTGGELGRIIREAAELERDFRGYIWYQLFRQSFMEMGLLFAVLLGSGGLAAEGSRGSALFTLSLPVSRRRLLGVRAAAGLAEFFVIVFVPVLLVPLLAPAIGEHYGVGTALVHGVCFFVAGATFFSLAQLVSTAFNDLWRPLLITLGVAFVWMFCEAMLAKPSSYGLFAVMRGELYFRTGTIPWVGLIVSAGMSAAMLYGATLNIARQDF